MKNKLIFVDAETDGLYGTYLSVAMIVTDLTAGKILEEVYWGIKDAEKLAKEPWVRENVISRMGDYEECADEAELLEKVWAFWQKHADSSYAVADVQYPVEARLFQKCVAVNEAERKFQAPFPMLDLSTILFWEGYSPIADRTGFLEDKKCAQVHNALYDTKMAAYIWNKLWRRKNHE